MKKVLNVVKIILIIALVGAAIGGTCYFFYNYILFNVDAFASFNTVIYGSQTVEFNAKLDEVRAYAGDRFDLIVDTNEKLGEIAENINYHLVNADDFDLDERLIVTQIDKVAENQEIAYNMMEEYLIKVDSDFFNKETGANDLFNQMSRYFVTFADMIDTINSELDKTNIVKNADVKFSIIEVYCDVCIDTFSNLILEASGIRMVENRQNIDLINQSVNFESGYISSSNAGDNFSYLSNYFISNYNACDKQTFATNLAQNVNQIVSITDSSTSLVKATYYFKGVLGI